MSDTLRRRLLLAAPVALAAWVAVLIGATWAQRWSYPYDLEWMEGGILAHAWRIQQFEPVYGDPSAEFVPMIYPPGYYVLLALVGGPFGLSAPLGRALSILGTLAACGALVWGSREHLGRWVPGLVASGVYLGTYELTGAFQDLVRPDAVGLGLLAWSLVVAPSDRPRAATWAGVLLFLSFTAKHNAGAFALAIAPALWVLRGRASAIQFSVAFFGPAMLFTGAVQLLSGGNFLAYLLAVPASHPMKWLRFLPGTPTEIGTAMPVVCVAVAVLALTSAVREGPRWPVPGHVLPAVIAAGILVLATQPFKENQGGVGASGLILVGAGGMASLTGLIGQIARRRIDGHWLYGTLVVGTAMVTAGLMRGHHGGFVNVFMPACWVLSAAFGVAISRAIDDAPADNGTALVALAAAIQLALPATTTDLSRFLPTEADRAAGDHIVERLRTVEGPVLSPFAAWMPALAGKAPSVHLIALWDVGHKGGPFPDGIEPIKDSIRNGHWGAIVDSKDAMGYGARRFYRIDEEFPLEGRALTPRTGWKARPTMLLVPKGGGS